MANAKNGIQGILYRERLPKLNEEIPTANANMAVKMRQN